MKKFVLGLISLSFFCFTGCMDLLDALFDSGGGSSSSEKTVTATETQSWNYDSSNPIFEADSSILSVEISGDIGGKSLYVVNANKTSSVISNKTQRYVSNASRSAISSDYPTEFSADTTSFALKKHFIPKEDVVRALKSKDISDRAAVSKSIAQKVSKITPTVDSTTKNIWVDNSTDMDKYAQKKATLRAQGDNCYVWVVNDYYTSGTASGSKVDSAIAKKFAKKFDEIYPMITYVFGNESDKLIDYENSASDFSLLPMNGYCDTGTKINIVIYDIGVDSSLPESQQCGVLGYFYSKDYITNISGTTLATLRLQKNALGYTNEGKYFYIDSAYSVKEIDSVISTLAHEFQHMVHFNKKTILKNCDSDTAYNEMLSVLCEDLMQKKLGLSDEKSVKGERLPGFNTMYFMSGLTEYRNDNLASISYSTLYTFGAWLCREYGGAALVKAMIDNDYVGRTSIVKAVNSLNDTDFTFEQLFRQFLLAITGSPTYTLEKDAAQTVRYSSSSTTYDYPMEKINLWSNDFAIPDSIKGELSSAKYSTYDWKGPFLFANGYSSELRPEYGISVHKLEDISAGTKSKTIEFSATGNENLTIYLIIQ